MTEDHVLPDYKEYTCTFLTHPDYWNGYDTKSIELEVSRDEKAVKARFPGIRTRRFSELAKAPKRVAGPDSAVCNMIDSFLAHRG